MSKMTSPHRGRAALLGPRNVYVSDWAPATAERREPLFPVSKMGHPTPWVKRGSRIHQTPAAERRHKVSPGRKPWVGRKKRTESRRDDRKAGEDKRQRLPMG